MHPSHDATRRMRSGLENSWWFPRLPSIFINLMITIKMHMKTQPSFMSLIFSEVFEINSDFDCSDLSKCTLSIEIWVDMMIRYQCTEYRLKRCHGVDIYGRARDSSRSLSRYHLPPVHLHWYRSVQDPYVHRHYSNNHSGMDTWSYYTSSVYSRGFLWKTL